MSDLACQQRPQMECLIEALHLALARPNPAISILGNPDETSRVMIGRGATQRRNRFGFGGAFVGHTYLAADGRVVGETMTACGNPR